MTAPNYGNPAGDGPLRIDGVSATGIPSRDADLPSTWSDAAKKQQHALKIVRDLEGGTETVRAETTAYLPQAPGEDVSNYKHRLARSVFFNAFQNTVEGLTGFVFAKDPVLGDDVPPQIAGTETQPGHWENIDLAGTHGDVFVRNQFQDALGAGHNAILVEFPNTAGEQDYRSEQTGEIRPYWVPIKKDNIVSWRSANISGQTVLTQIVLKECTMVADGAFGEKEQTRYRVFRREDGGAITVQLLEVTDKKEVREVSSGSYPTQEEIPIAEITTSGRCDLFESRPPLLDLAYLNIAHYQQWSDRAYSIHKTCVPIYVETGVDTSDDEKSPIVIGPNSARRFSNSDADAKYVTHDGAALGEVRSAIEELKSDMSVLGLAMLAPQKRAAETAEAKRIDKAASDSKLGVSARGLQDGVERALGFHARYLRIEDGGSIQINRDFENNVMDAPMMTAIADFCVKLDIPVRMALEALKRGNSPLISDSDNLDEIEREIMANQAAKAAQAADEAALLAAQNKPPVPQAA